MLGFSWLLSPYAHAQTSTPCNCTEYVYINEETNGGNVHKFEITPSTGQLTEIGSPWFSGAALPNPHGLAYDLNGFSYIGDDFTTGNIRRLTCDGTIRPASEFFVTNGSGTANFGSIGNTLYTNTGTSYDLCTGTSGPTVSYAGVPATAVPWGFYIDPLTNDFFGTSPKNVFRFSADDYGSGTPIQPFITEATIEANLPTSYGDQTLDNVDDGLYGVTTDPSGNIYVAVWYDMRKGLIMKFDPNGNFITSINDQVEDTDGFWAPRGLVYSFDANGLYVSSNSTTTNCISLINLDLTTVTGVVGPTGGIPNTIGRAKAMTVVKECCPTAPGPLEVTRCVTTSSEPFYLSELVKCANVVPAGTVCEAQWMPIGAASMGIVNNCNQVIANPAPGCYEFQRSSTPTGLKQCAAFSQTLFLEIIAADAVSLSADQTVACGATPADLVATTNGTVVRWEMTTATCTAENLWTPIAGTAGLTTYNPGPINETTRFRAIVNSTSGGNGAGCSGGSCEEVSNCVTINTATTCPTCNVSIDRVDVTTCFFDETTNSSLASVSVEISWDEPAPGPPFSASLAAPRRDSIAVTLNGQTKFVYLEAPFVNRSSVIQGYYPLSSPQLIRFSVPADGMTNQSVIANFTTAGSCQVNTTYDRPVACPPDPCIPNANTVGGIVFEDLNTNGSIDPGEPNGIVGVTVNIYGCDASGNSVLIGTTVTDGDGDYYFDANNTSPPIADGQDYRVEFIQPNGTQILPSCGSSNGYTTVQFASAPSCGVNMGFINPVNNCQPSPDIIVTCYVSGRSTSSNAPNFGTIVRYPYGAPDGNFGGNSGNNAGPSNRYYANHRQTGAVWGMAYRARDSLLFSSAVIRRQSGLGPQGAGGIYVTDLTQAPPPNASSAITGNFLDLTFGGVFNFGTVPARPDLANSATSSNNRDGNILPAVATMGIGDIEVSTDGNDLYVVNLFDRHLYEIDISGYDGTAATRPTVGDVNRYPIPDPCAGTGQLRPWGLKIDGNNIWVGSVCDASVTNSREDLRAYVYRFDKLTSTFTTTPVMNFPLNYPRGAGTVDPGLWDKNVWEPWSNDWDSTRLDQNDWHSIRDGSINGQPRLVYDYPQPILADIELDADNTLILVFNDRTSLQIGNLELAPSGPTYMGHTAAGDILRAFSPDGQTYILESEARSGNFVGSNPNNFQGPGYGEFFDDNFFGNPGELVHSELVVGGAAIAPGSGQTIVATADPTNGTNFANGTRTYNNQTGQVDASYTVYTSANLASAPTFGKTAGLGDVQLLCNPLGKLEIGNYVWQDVNGDGVQDPCEPPLAGVVVGLYADDGTLLATTTTDQNGQYYFSEDGVPGQNWVMAGGSLDPNTDYTVAFGIGQFDDANGGLDLGSDTLYTVTASMTGQLPLDSLNDSDPDPDMLSTAMGDLPAGLPFAVVTTPQTGVDHSVDLGFVPMPPILLTLGSTVFTDNNNDGMLNGADMGIPGVEVQLWDNATMMQVFTSASGMVVANAAAAAPTLTDADGNYFFTQIPPGDYYVVIPSPPTTAPISSNNTSTGFTETDPDDDMDDDDDGLQAGGSGTAVQSGVITLVEDGEPINEPGQGGGQDTVSALGFTDNNGNMTLDFGFFAPVSVGDTTFADLNANGIQDPGEPPVAGVTVMIFNADGTPVMFDAEGTMYNNTTTTNMDGVYQFANLPPGNYYVEFDPSTVPGSEFLSFTASSVGNDANDSDADPATGQTDNTGVLLSGGSFPNLDAGFTCRVMVEAGNPQTLCSTDSVTLASLGASFAPTDVAGFSATWTTTGDGTFVPNSDAGTATVYRLGQGDVRNGEVQLILTTDDPMAAPFNNAVCGPLSDTVLITIQPVDCGQFFWDGNN